MRFLRGFSNYLTPKLGSVQRRHLGGGGRQPSQPDPELHDPQPVARRSAVRAVAGGAAVLDGRGVARRRRARQLRSWRPWPPCCWPAYVHGRREHGAALTRTAWTKSGTSTLRPCDGLHRSRCVPPLLAVGSGQRRHVGAGPGASRVISDAVFVGWRWPPWRTALSWAMSGSGRWAWYRQPLVAARSDAGRPLDGGRGEPLVARSGPGLVLVSTAFMAGAARDSRLALGSRALLGFVGRRRDRGASACWSFPLGVVSLFLCVTAHLGLAGRHMSEETREWWGRVGGVQLLVGAAARRWSASSRWPGRTCRTTSAANGDWFQATPDRRLAACSAAPGRR